MGIPFRRYFVPEMDAKYCAKYQSVCQPVCPLYQKPHDQTLPMFVLVDCSRGLVLLLQRWYTLCTSGLADNVMFSVWRVVCLPKQPKLVHRLQPVITGSEVCRLRFLTEDCSYHKDSLHLTSSQLTSFHLN